MSAQAPAHPTDALPKVELHCHLDGSVGPALLGQLYKQGHGDLPRHFAEGLRAPERGATLTEYLAPFWSILPLLQTAEALEAAAADVLRQAAADNVVYTEIRFAPASHLAGGLTPDEVVKAVCHGLRTAQAETGVAWGLLLCMMVGGEEQANAGVVDLAARHTGEGVVGVDLAGDENLHSPARYAPLFQRARALGLPYTIHAGENGPPENVAAALDLGARRIGHGVAIRKSPALMDRCRDEDVLLELCPTSNLQTGAVASPEDFPFDLFLQNGVPFCLNTDNRTVSAVTLNEEYRAVAARFYHARPDELRRLNREALAHAFASEQTKGALAGRL